jgi:hypothetical protein
MPSQSPSEHLVRHRALPQLVTEYISHCMPSFLSESSPTGEGEKAPSEGPSRSVLDRGDTQFWSSASVLPSFAQCRSQRKPEFDSKYSFPALVRVLTRCHCQCGPSRTPSAYPVLFRQRLPSEPPRVFQAPPESVASGGGRKAPSGAQLFRAVIPDPLQSTLIRLQIHYPQRAASQPCSHLLSLVHGVSPIAATAMTGFSLVLTCRESWTSSQVIGTRAYAADYTVPLRRI